jgi:hypothetical protein
MKGFISNIHFAAQDDCTSGPPLPTPKRSLLEDIINDTVVLFGNKVANVIL